MKFIIYGTGAIGGTMAARLALSGHDVAAIARGPHLEAMRTAGLRLNRPSGSEVAHFPCHAGPEEIAFDPGDVVLVTVKSQHTAEALERLAAAGVREQAVVCAQNGVANERAALRVFENVYGLLLMMPATHMEPGVVSAFGMPCPGILDIGRFPRGTDATVTRLVKAFNAAGFAAYARDAVMADKRGKLLLNLRNVIEAAVGSGSAADAWYDRARAEAERVFDVAGLGWTDVGANDPRRAELMTDTPIEGVERVGSSSRQSLVRHAGSIETDYLNGEIALLGRLHGVPVPVNAFLCRLGRELVAGRHDPGAVPADLIEKHIETAKA